MSLRVFISLISIGSCFMHSIPKNAPHQHMHPQFQDVHNDIRTKRSIFDNDQERTAHFWNVGAQLKLRDQLLKQPNRNTAKNVIFFLGDGMSIPTITAARMYLGQQQGHTGEESRIFFEEFPYTGLSKTYCVDKQVADSACSATAYLTGVKGNYGTIGVTAAVAQNDCEAGNKRSNHVSSILQWAQRAGKGTGLVTTTRITHATPTGTYGHVSNREYECDADVVEYKQDPLKCQDIASQLIHNEPGKNIKVIFGGGRSKFIPKDDKDEDGQNGQRLDGVNLINLWKKTKRGPARYIFNKKGLDSLDYNKTEYVLGLFDSNHLKYNLDADRDVDPSLPELTVAAVRMLQKEQKGYFLFVEGGRIDHAHHDAKAKKALDETVQFSEAVRLAVELTSREDTLIVVTSDHAHTMSLAGYSKRGSNVLGVNTQPSDVDKLPYSTLAYANGPGFKIHINGSRETLTDEMLASKDFQYPAINPMTFETHGGDDVAVFALGPWSHLFTGVYEQNVIPHMIAYASCIGEGLTACKRFSRK